MKNLKKTISLVLASTLVLNGFINFLVKKGYCMKVKNNAIIYQNQIDEYNKKIKDYAIYINSLGLTEIEIIMKVMNDIWCGIEGYGVSDNLIEGYYRLSFQEEGKGVCTSFADDFTAKINAINPRYDAKNIIVYAKDINDENIKRTNIERNVLDYIEESPETEKKEKRFGNHMVSVIRIDKYNLYLVVDVTKLLIGILENGKIKVLNCDNRDFMDYKFNSSLLYSEEGYIEFYKDYFNTYFKANISDKNILDIYGYEAQEKALKKIKKIK